MNCSTRECFVSVCVVLNQTLEYFRFSSNVSASINDFTLTFSSPFVDFIIKHDLKEKLKRNSFNLFSANNEILPCVLTKAIGSATFFSDIDIIHFIATNFDLNINNWSGSK